MEEKKEIRFKLPETVKFPEQLFPECKSMEEIQQILQEKFISVQRKDVKAERHMSAEEINEIREEYGDIMESELPELRESLEALKEDYTNRKKNLESQIGSCETKVRDLVAQAKNGLEDYPLSPDESFRIPVRGHYLYYTWVDGKAILAMVQRIPDHEHGELFNSGDINDNILIEMGYELPEVEIKDTRKNVRLFTGTEWGDIEVYEEEGQDVFFHRWIDDYADEDTGEVLSIDRFNVVRFYFSNSPFRDGTYTPVGEDIEESKDQEEQEENETEKQEGETEQLPEEPTKESGVGRGKKKGKAA